MHTKLISKIYYYNSYINDSAYDFGFSFKEMVECCHSNGRPIVFLCIGTDRSTGDSLGPLIGYKLAKMVFPNTHIYGTLGSPVHALNLNEVLDIIYMQHDNPFIIAIDASLGAKNHIGYVTLTDSSLRPGLGVKKSLPAVGDLSITGIVNISGSTDSTVLQSTRLSTVMNMADCIVRGIRTAFLTM